MPWNILCIFLSITTQEARSHLKVDKFDSAYYMELKCFEYKGGLLEVFKYKDNATVGWGTWQPTVFQDITNIVYNIRAIYITMLPRRLSENGSFIKHHFIVLYGLQRSQNVTWNRWERLQVHLQGDKTIYVSYSLAINWNFRNVVSIIHILGEIISQKIIMSNLTENQNYNCN